MKVVAALGYVLLEVLRPFLGAAAVVGDKKTAAWLEPLEELGKESKLVLDMKNGIATVHNIKSALGEILLCDVGNAEHDLTFRKASLGQTFPSNLRHV